MKVSLRTVRDKQEAIDIVRNIGVDEHVVEDFADKIRFRILEIDDVTPPVATIIKQIAISRGTDAAVHRKVIVNDIQKSSLILPGTVRELKLISDEMKKQPFDVPLIGEKILSILNNTEKKREIKIMGILNITPDSFSDGGKYIDENDAIKRYRQLKDKGADIIDIGAESSRPGARPVSVDEELSRIKPVIPLIEENNVVVSIDTYKSKVAEKLLDAGAKIVNDISALRMDGNMAGVVADRGASVVLMHMQGTPETMQKEPYYEDVIGEIKDFFEERIDYSISQGISEENIIIDPGIGFGKRQKDNLEILRKLDEFLEFGFPVMVGTSRKSFLGRILEKDVDDRLSGSISSAVYSAMKGASILRVHDISETIDAISVFRSIEGIE